MPIARSRSSRLIDCSTAVSFCVTSSDSGTIAPPCERTPIAPTSSGRERCDASSRARMSMRRPPLENLPTALPPTSALTVLPRSLIDTPRSLARRRSGTTCTSGEPIW